MGVEMSTVPLRETEVGVLNGSGGATLKVGPLSAREVWHPQNVAVSGNANPTNEAQCNVYMGPDTTQNSFRDATVSGSTGDSTDRCNGDTVKVGMWIWAVWTGGDPGANVVLNVTGTKDV